MSADTVTSWAIFPERHLFEGHAARFHDKGNAARSIIDRSVQAVERLALNGARARSVWRAERGLAEKGASRPTHGGRDADLLRRIRRQALALAGRSGTDEQ